MTWQSKNPAPIVRIIQNVLLHALIPFFIKSFIIRFQSTHLKQRMACGVAYEYFQVNSVNAKMYYSKQFLIFGFMNI